MHLDDIAPSIAACALVIAMFVAIRRLLAGVLARSPGHVGPGAGSVVCHR